MTPNRTNEADTGGTGTRERPLGGLNRSWSGGSAGGSVLMKSKTELRTMLHGEVGRRSGNVATGDFVERVDAFDVWAEVSVE